MMTADDLRAAIAYLQMSQAGFARRINYTPVAINQMATGKRPVSRTVELETERLLRESER